jgi:hypothetical protein
VGDGGPDQFNAAYRELRGSDAERRAELDVVLLVMNSGREASLDARGKDFGAAAMLLIQSLIARRKRRVAENFRFLLEIPHN